MSRRVVLQQLHPLYGPRYNLFEFHKYIGVVGQEWKLDGVLVIEAVCCSTPRLSFFFYASILEKMTIQIPFSPF